MALMTDGTPAHNQTVDFDKSKGSHSIDSECAFAKASLEEALQNRRAAFVQGDENIGALTQLIKERNLFAVQLTSKGVADLVPSLCNNLAEYYGQEHISFTALLYDPMTGKQLLVMSCMQVGTTLFNPQDIHGRGNIFHSFYDEFIRAFVVLAGGPRDVLPPYTTYGDSRLAALKKKEGADAFNMLLHEKKLLPPEHNYRAGHSHGGKCMLLCHLSLTNTPNIAHVLASQ